MTHVGSHLGDGPLEVGPVKSGPLAEGANGEPEALHTGFLPPSPGARSARWPESMRRGAGPAPGPVDVGAEGPDVDVVPASAQLEEQRHHREEVPDGGRRVGKDRGHGVCLPCVQRPAALWWWR